MINLDNVDRPAILAEVTAAFYQYEEALVSNNIEALDALFWHDPCGEVIVYAWMDRRRENSEKPYGTRLRAGLAVSARLVGKCDFLEIYALTSALLWIVSVSS